MRAKEFLSESRVKRLELDQAAQVIKANCGSAWQHFLSGKSMYRGIKSAGTSCLLGDTAGSSPRRSANTFNYYTYIIDNSKEWAAYPKRNQSFICTTSEDYAGNYGWVYNVFPFDGTNIGVCPDMDIWNSFEDTLQTTLGIDTLDALNENINRLLRATSIIASGKDQQMFRADSSLDEFVKALRTAEKVLRDGHFVNANYLLDAANAKAGTNHKAYYVDLTNSVILDLIYKNPNGIWKYLCKLLSPKRSGFELMPIEHFYSPRNREVWFSGKAVFVREDEVDLLKRAIEQNLIWSQTV